MKSIFFFSFWKDIHISLYFHVYFYINSSGWGEGGELCFFVAFFFFFLSIRIVGVAGTTWRSLEKLNNLKGIKKGPDFTQTTIC